MKPPRSILDKAFVYTKAREHQGDPTYLLRKFRRMQREAKENQAEAKAKVQTIHRRKA